MGNPGISQFHVSELQRDAAAAVDWLGRLGLKCSQGRIRVYKEKMDRITDLWTKGKLQEYVRNGHELEVVTILLEAHELGQIYQGLKTELRPAALEKLRTYINGPFSYVEENPAGTKTTSPRNFGFELSLEAQLQAAQFHITTDTIEDIAIEYRGHFFSFECKRPQTPEAVIPCIEEANSQLKKRYKSGLNHGLKRGIFGLSLTKAINPNCLIFDAKNEAELHSELEKMGDAVFFKDHSRWHGKLHPQTAAGLAQWNLIAYLEDSDKITLCQMGLIYDKRVVPMDSAMVDAIGKQLRNSVGAYDLPLSMTWGSFQRNLSRNPFDKPWGTRPISPLLN